MEKNTKIPVHIVNGNAFIWDPEDVITLRIKYRIVGSLVGLLPKSPLQNIFSSLPLHLLPEEVSLLLEKGFIYLVNDKKAHHKPNNTEIKLYNDEQEKLKEKDNQEFQKQKNEHMQKNLNKKNKNASKNTSNKDNNLTNENKNDVNNSKTESGNEITNDTNKISNNVSSNTVDTIINNNGNNIENDNNNNINNAVTTSNANSNNSNNLKENKSENDKNVNDNNKKDNNNNANEPKKKKKEKEKSQLVHIQTNSKNLPWYNPSENNHENECYTLEEAKSKNIWNYPNTPNELLKYKIFCDIWEKPEKYFITSGSKYGSDYLIYPGDPVQYHSNFIATVIYDKDFKYSPKYIIKYGRLGTNVKKTHLLCNIDQTTQKINYYSIEWSSWI